MLSVAACLIGHPARATYLPSIQIGTAALISSSAADSHYGSNTVSGDGLRSLTGVETPTPPEIIELARALKNDPDQIYQYVENNIDIVWMYGLQKGALGAEIDKSGTAFDQAELMVALLRQSSIPASYIAGTIVLTQTQFYNWSGITNARAACQLLANGSIPATINGITTTKCATGFTAGATVSSVQMSHIWVRVTIGGTNYVFDPAYKTYGWKTGLSNLATVMGFTSGAPLAAALTGYHHGTDTSGALYANTLNATSLNTALQGYANNLRTYMQAQNLGGGQLADILGGGTITPVTTQLRQTALPYADPSPPYTPHVWTPASDTARYNAIPVSTAPRCKRSVSSIIGIQTNMGRGGAVTMTRKCSTRGSTSTKSMGGVFPLLPIITWTGSKTSTRMSSR